MMRLLQPIDRLLDRITMYRLLLYHLLVVLAAAAVLNLTLHVLYGPWAIALSASYLVLVCWVSNEVFARVYHAPVNTESSLITGLILALIITPIASLHDLLFLTAAGGLAIASKYLLAWRNSHIFNPAAAAVAITALAAGQSASWWVGVSQLLPFVLVGGLLVVRKVQRLQMMTVFVAAALVSTAVAATVNHAGVGQALQIVLLHSPLWFLATVMLTEPQTSPATEGKRRWYAALVGGLLPPQIHIGGLYSTPELALLAGNILAFAINPRVKLLPRLVGKAQVSPDTLDLVFQPDRHLAYQPGQYMEFTLPHAHMDGRGERRYFTLASSPTEDTLRLGVKFYQPGSSFKRTLKNLTAQTPIAAGQLGGDFVLPKRQDQKLAFIAGGIGITPYRSMLKFLVDRGEQRDVHLLYGERNAVELAYRDVLEAARQRLGVQVTYILEDTAGAPPGSLPGRINGQLITKEIPDYTERLFYLSGPHPMVAATEQTLRELGVSRSNIKVDFFPGYA